MTLTTAESQATLDARFPTTGATDYVAYSEDGSTETARLARTAIGATGWAAATAADPSVKANANSLTSAAVTAGANITVTHARIMTASSGGTARTDWRPLAASKTLAAGETLIFPVGTVVVTLT